MTLPWWIWVLAALVGLVVLGAYARRSWRASIRAELKAFLAEKHPDWEVVEEQVLFLLLRHRPSGESITFAFDPLYAMATQAKTVEERRILFGQAAGSLQEALEAQQPLVPERDLPRVLPRLVRKEFVDNPDAAGLLHQPLEGTELFVSYVVDRPFSAQYVTEKQRAELGEDLGALHARALENLARKAPLDSLTGAFASPNVNVIKLQDQYDAARLLLLPSLLPEGTAIAAAVPDRDTLVVAPEPANQDWEPLVRLATAAAGPALLQRPLRVSRSGIEQR